MPTCKEHLEELTLSHDRACLDSTTVEEKVEGLIIWGDEATKRINELDELIKKILKRVVALETESISKWIDNCSFYQLDADIKGLTNRVESLETKDKD